MHLNTILWALIKDAQVLEVLEKVDRIIVDKTDTLTEGRPRLTAIIPIEPTPETELLAATVARHDLR